MLQWTRALLAAGTLPSLVDGGTETGMLCQPRPAGTAKGAQIHHGDEPGGRMRGRCWGWFPVLSTWRCSQEAWTRLLRPELTAGQPGQPGGMSAD